MSARRYRHCRRIGKWHLLLTLSLLAQSVIPLQAHSVMVAKPNGGVVVVCTWQGMRTVDSGLDGHESDASQSFSPALLFSQLLASADLAAFAVAQTALYQSFAAVVDRPGVPTSPAIFRAYVIRAPPALRVPQLT